MTRPRSPRPRLRGGTRRRGVVLLELVTAAAICFAGYAFGAEWMQVQEARWVVSTLRLFGLHEVSGALPGHILVFGADGLVLNAEVTASCSSVLSVTGLTALTVAVFRGRRLHAFGGLAAAVTFLVLLNGVRLAASTLAGIWWGRPAMILFHDWVGSLWNLTATFAGFLVLVAITLPTPERAEQDASGRHTARRPSSWARPGLGYQLGDTDENSRRGGRRLTAFFYRYVLPRRLAGYLGARREAGRIDYRIGHMSPADRMARIRQLVADGLGAHTASLLAVATYDRDPEVLDTLAGEVAARQWEPVTSHRVTSLRLWARAWMMARALPLPGGGPSPDRAGATGPRTAAVTGADPATPSGLGRPAGRASSGSGDRPTQSIADVVTRLRSAASGGSSPDAAALPITALSALRARGRSGVPRRPVPRSFARPIQVPDDATAEDVR